MPPSKPKNNDQQVEMHELDPQKIVNAGSPFDVQKAMEQAKKVKNKAADYSNKTEKQMKNERRRERTWLADSMTRLLGTDLTTGGAAPVSYSAWKKDFRDNSLAEMKMKNERIKQMKKQPKKEATPKVPQ